jgi:hypothetical protein
LLQYSLELARVDQPVVAATEIDRARHHAGIPGRDSHRRR